MQYKLLSVDVDGTLINSKKQVTPKTKEKIQQAVEKGVIFTISSGRPVQGVQLITDQLGMDAPVITYNGAMAITGESRTIIYSCNMEKEDALQIEMLGKQRDTLIAIWSDNKLYVNHMNELALKYSTISGTEPILYTDIEPLIEKGINKILWYDDVERINAFEEELKTVINPTVNYHTSQPFFLEFVNINASKAIALEKLGNHYGISKEEMIAIGDGFNDLSMIEYAGLGVAMENAPEEIKQAADFVTLSNEDDGVAYVIDKFILNK